MQRSIPTGSAGYGITETNASVDLRPLTDSKATSAYLRALMQVLAQYYAGVGRPILRGRFANLLGLAGPITPKELGALLDNRHPKTGKRLTMRNAPNRVMGWGLCFGVPKSVSIRGLVDGDRRLLVAMEKAVQATMDQAERCAGVAVRDGENYNTRKTRRTSNLLYVLIPDFIARPTPGEDADPHLHIHVVLINASWDGKRWRALEPSGLMEHILRLQAQFQVELARQVEALDHSIAWQRSAWEIAGVTRQEVLLFSGRARQVEQIATETKTRDEASKARIASRYRASKGPARSLEERVKEWRQKREQNLPNYAQPQPSLPPPAPAAKTVEEALRRAQRHLEEDHWAWSRDAWAAAAIYAGRGHIKIDQIEQGIDALVQTGGKGDIIAITNGERICYTSRPVADAIADCVRIANAGRGKYPAQAYEDAGQTPVVRRVVGAVLGCTDQVCGLDIARGKSRGLILQAITAAYPGKHEVVTLAVTPKSLEHLRLDKHPAMIVRGLDLLPQTRKPKLIIADDGDHLSAVAMRYIFEKALEYNAKVVLVGDASSGAARNRGDALRHLALQSGVPLISLRRPFLSGRVTHIVAPKPDSPPPSSGNAPKGALPDAGRVAAVVVRRGFAEISDDPEVIEQSVIHEIIKQSASKHPTIAVASEQFVPRLNEAVRQNLLHSTVGPALSDARFMDTLTEVTGQPVMKDDVLRLTRDCRHGHADEELTVVGSTDSALLAKNRRGRVQQVVPTQDAYRVFRPHLLEVAVGDRLQLTESLTTTEHEWFFPGEVVTVSDFQPDGRIRLQNGRTLPADFCHFRHGWIIPPDIPVPNQIDRVLIADLDPESTSALERLSTWAVRCTKRVLAFTGAASLASRLGFQLQRPTALEQLAPASLPAVMAPQPNDPPTSSPVDTGAQKQPSRKPYSKTPSSERSFEIMRRTTTSTTMEIEGPYTGQQMREIIRGGSFSVATLVRQVGEQRWKPASQYPEFLHELAKLSLKSQTGGGDASPDR